MKNDVVGWWWSSKGHDTSKHLKPIFAEHSNSNICPTKEYAAKQHVAKLSSTTSLLSHSTLLCQQQQEQQQQKRTLATSSNNYSNITKTITNEKSFQCDISSSKHYNNNNNNNNNNINYNDLYTVETVANLRRKTIKSAHCRPHYHHQHHHLYHHHHRQQRHHQHEHVYQRRGGGQGFAARSLCLQSLSVRLCSGDRKAYLMLLLQFTVVVLICSLNIGFVTCANVVKNQRQSTLSLYTDNDNLLDVLDYDDSGNSIGGDESDAIGHYTHTWAVHIPDGDKEDKVNAVARDHGFVNLGKIFGDHYHFAHHKVSKRSLVPALPHQSRLAKDKRVKWSQQQIAKSRQKRDFIRIRPSRTSSSRALSLVDAVPFSDPKWSQMWYLNRGGGLDMNVIPAWKEGITGKGIVVTILDDGLESDHPDIINNYDARASYDVNSHDEDPMPHYDLTDSNRHGTRCAGEVAATANNSICAVGIAFGASVGGVRMLDGDVTDAVEARSLSLNPQHIDIYSASWGPDDDGKTVDGPGELASRAFIEGVTKGRAGKGSIFIWASGNGGRELDNCNCDGYTNSIWTLSISSATEEGHVPWYSEKCSSTLATTYSSGGQAEKQVVTTDLHHSCTVSHTGTSASAPLAAGIAALVLESNQNLTWRDLQHIVVRTAKPANLKDTAWSKNGVGRRVSHSFGYGLMDAAAMVKVARSWKTVPEQQRCEINAPHVDKVIPPKSHITLQQTVKYCSINFLEHVQAKITLTSQRRGDIQLNLISPAGTKVTLLTPRMHDVSRSGFNQWPFMSVHTWGESPHGNWQLEIHNEGRYMAQITQWNLIFYGTELPAQPDDPIPVNSEHFSPYGNIMEHNDIEYDSSGQWHNMQQIGESSMMSHDRTNSSCLKATINRECLACAPPTFFFRGRCYDKCPSQTYVIKHNDMVDNISNIVTYQSKDDVDEELQSLERKRRYHYKTLKVNEFNIDRGETTTTENEGFFAPNIMLSCAACDVTCRQCYGPLNSQCSICFPGSQLRRIPYTNDSYCYMFAERSSGNNSHDSHSTVQQNKTNFNFLLPLLYLIPTFITISVIMLLIIYGWNNYLNKRNNSNGEMAATYAYDRVALISNEDDEVEAEMADNETDAGDDYHNQDEIDNKNVKKIVHKTVIKIYTDASEIL